MKWQKRDCPIKMELVAYGAVWEDVTLDICEDRRSRRRMTIKYPDLWETPYNPDFKPTEFGRFRKYLK